MVREPAIKPRPGLVRVVRGNVNSMTSDPEDLQAVAAVEIILDESGIPPQEGDTVYDAGGNYYRVIRSLGPAETDGWWLIEGKLIN